MIIPAFNAERFVSAAIDSAVAQTTPVHEIIVVDDGSTDGTVNLVKSYGAAVSLVRQQNGGAGRARNAGARAATGNWLAFLDADDQWRPEKLATQARAASADVALVYSDRFNCGDRGHLPPQAGMHLDLRVGESLAGLLKDNVITTSSVLLRRDVFEALGGFSDDPNVVPAEDWDLWLRVVARHKAKLCPEPLVDYRFHKSSVSRKDLKMNRARLLVLTRMLQSDACSTLSGSERRRILATCWMHNSYDAYRAGSRLSAAACCLRAAALDPMQWAPWRDLVKIGLGRI